MLGKKSWEEAESELQSRTAGLVIEKSGLSKEEIRYSFAGIFLAQLIATSFGNINLEIPMFGLYGACSTMGEGSGLGATCVEGGFAGSCSCRRFQPFRFGGEAVPFSVGIWESEAVFGYMDGDWVRSGDRVLRDCRGKEAPLAKITAVTTGKIVDMDFHDSMNMGPRWRWRRLIRSCKISGISGWTRHIMIRSSPGIWGQGRRLLLDYLMKAGYRIESRYMDCGIEMFSPEEQDTHAGGSGCGCSAAVLAGLFCRRSGMGSGKGCCFCRRGLCFLR